MHMTVGQVAKRAGVSVPTLHFYEKKGLITSTRDQGNRRQFDRQILRRIAVIKAAQNIGLSLQEIIDALATLPTHRAPKKEEWEQLALDWNKQLEAKIQSLKKLQNELSGCIHCGCLSMEKCKLYNPDDTKGVHEAGGSLIQGRPESGN
ncbi:redox-sensitive transcriptional activator SoxR [Vibrio sp. Isolate30]|uniref:redox-sensitive transcriptional activator SoxR n=1 Tax=Vibrio sp. Isolate30 TaxID=2908536 RepID=UPI001EFD62D2|nr:redox-sensitive transcriptional activator SoxR [Vibrio sp. Isolate30]MCG9629602.1 redox-sensitive transcriptional activator SoxR [Vibrio sp. Isolate30]